MKHTEHLEKRIRAYEGTGEVPVPIDLSVLLKSLSIGEKKLHSDPIWFHMVRATAIGILNRMVVRCLFQTNEEDRACRFS